MLGKRSLCPIPALLSVIILPPFPRPWMRLFVPELRPRQGRDLGFGIQGQRPNSGTHPSVLPASNIRLHFHGSPNLWRLLGGLAEKQAAHSLRCSAGVGVGWAGGSCLLPLIFPLIPSDSPRICSLQGWGMRLDLSPWLVLPPSSLTALVSQLHLPKTLLSPRSQRPLDLRYLKRGPASG